MTSRPSAPRVSPPERQSASPFGYGGSGPLILSVSVAPALSRLIAHDVSTRVLLPLLVTFAVADLVTALLARGRGNVAAAVAFGWVVGVAATLLIVDPSLVNPASSEFLHGGVLSKQLHLAHAALANDGTPLPASSGVVLVVGAIGAAAAALTRGTWIGLARRRSGAAGRGPLSPCLAPSLAIFIYSTLVSAEQDRVAAFGAYLVGVLAFVAVADRGQPAYLSRPTARARAPRMQRSRSAAGVVVATVLVALVVLAAGAGLSGMRLTVFHVTPPPAPLSRHSPSQAGAAAQNLITGISLVDNLLDTEVSDSNVVIFNAHSPVPTYWEVGTLSSFNGTAWLPASGVRAALAGTGGTGSSPLASSSLPSPTPAQTFTAHVAIANFVSRLLPAPPGTRAVSGLEGGATVTQEGVLAPTATASGRTYAVIAPLDTAIPTSGKQLAPSDARLAPYLSLPTEPPVVAQLARQAVGNADTPETKAQALVDWFRSGRFRYTLSPPATKGSDPLVQFLTVTKAGYCAQFAGAYGVLARTLSIPTRLVVGFTAGQAEGGGAYTVTGADAHVWPQVYLGPSAGWVSVEPTPSALPGNPTPEGVLGVAGTSSPQSTTAGPPTSAPPQTVPASGQPAASGQPGASQHETHSGPRSHRAGTRQPHGGSWVVWALLLLALLVLGSFGAWLWTRRRSILETRLPPDQQVVQAWELALVALRRKGLPRRSDETPREYAARIRSVEFISVESAEADAVASLATLVEMACYANRPCTPGQVADAQTLASTIRQGNRSHRRRLSNRASSRGYGTRS